jgi:tetratricopeptide (TPR) repeat protein
MRPWHVYTAAILAFLVLAGGVGRSQDAPAPSWIDAGYSGRYARLDAFREYVRELPGLRRSAIERFNDTLGCGYKDSERITVSFRDASDPDADIWKRFTGGFLETSWDGTGPQRHPDIVIHAEFVVNGLTDRNRQFTHEMTHAICREIMGERYSALPKWLREGIALYNAEQGEDRITYFLTFLKYAREPGKLLNGLLGEHSMEDYPEDYLAVRFLVETRGRNVIMGMIDTIVSGKTAEDAVKAATGLEFGDFEKAARAWAADRLKAMRDPATNDYLAIMEQNSRVESVESARTLGESCAKFLEKHGDSYLAANVRYYAAKAMQLMNRFPEAIAAYDEFARTCPDQSYLLDDSLLRRAECMSATGRHSEAVALLERLVLDFPNSLSLEDGSYVLGIELEKAGESWYALRALEKALRSFPKSAWAPRAAKLVEDLRWR